MTDDLLNQGNAIKGVIGTITFVQTLLPAEVPDTPTLDDLIAWVSSLKANPVANDTLNAAIATAAGAFLTAANTALATGITTLNTQFTALGNE